MAIHVQCPSCGGHFVAPPQLAGQAVRCGQCQNVLSVPAATSPIMMSPVAGERSQKPLPADRQLPPKPTGLERTSR